MTDQENTTQLTISHGDYSRLQKLQKEYAELFEKKDHMVSQEEPFLTAIYVTKISPSAMELFSLQIEVSRLKAKKEAIQAYINRGKKPDLKTIEKQLDEQFAEYYKRLAQEDEDLKSAKEYINAPSLSEEQSKEFKEIYRQLVKRLHPDLHPEQSEADKELFLKVQAAYHSSDLAYLRSVLMKLTNESGDYSYVTPDYLDNLEVLINTLKEQIDLLNHSFPFNMREKLADKEWIVEHVAETDEKIKKLKIEKLHLERLVEVMEEYGK